MLAGLPFGLHEIDDARLVRPDWVITKPILSGICGSDAKLVLGDFSTGDIDNPMAAFSSLPHVPGHEVVAEVVALGPQATGSRGRSTGRPQPLAHLRPAGHRRRLCPPCAAGDLSLCWSFTKGDLGAGRPRRRDHRGPGCLGRAPGCARLHAHSRARRHLRTRPPSWPIPSRCPSTPSSATRPRRAGGCWSTAPGRWASPAWPSCDMLYPDVEVGVVARFEAQRDMALRFGASQVFAHEPRLALVEALAEWSGAVLHTPFDGLPVTHPGHIDVVYDTIAKARDPRGRRPGAGRAGPPRLHGRLHPAALGVDARSTSRS